MSATNKTTYLELPIFIGTDTPSWLGDWNNTMNTIDTAVNGANNAASDAQSTANSAVSKSDGNTETIKAMNTELETIKEAVQNYDAILDFKEVNSAYAVNNLAAGNHNFMLLQNPNKTLNVIKMYTSFLSPLNNPTKYTYTFKSGSTVDFYDLFTIEDNCFNLNQGSQPNGNICLWIGHATSWLPGENPSIFGRSIEAWFDGATTHIGFRNDGNISMPSRYVLLNATVFLSGSVYEPSHEDSV